MSHKVKYILFFLIILLAGLVRFARISERMMHNDEAVNAHKLGVLLETGEYRYDREEYHGPALYYLSLAVARLTGHQTHASLQEHTLRMVPAIFSVLTIILLLMLRRTVNWSYILVAGGMMALAPMMVFYGRDYIHETLLTFFTLLFLLAIYRYLQEHRLSQVVIAGVSAGLMHATKETSVIQLAAAILALLVMVPWRKGNDPSPGKSGMKIPRLHWLLFLGSGLFTSVLFYSSFLTHPKGILDSVTTYISYFQRAGQDQAHIRPWYYYLSLLTGPWRMNGFFTSELWLLILAAAGWGTLWRDRGSDRSAPVLLFLGTYSLILLIIYSLIPYKTPWNMLQFYPGLLFLSAWAMVRLFRSAGQGIIRRVLSVVVIAGGIHWAGSGLMLNFRYEDHPLNPYVYAHTSPDVKEVVRMLDRLAEVHPEGYDLPLEVIFPENEYWPLPWYLRQFTKVGYYDRVPFHMAASPVLIVSPAVEEELVRRLYELPPPGERFLYTSLTGATLELRHGVELRTYVRKDIWDVLQFREQ